MPSPAEQRGPLWDAFVRKVNERFVAEGSELRDLFGDEWDYFAAGAAAERDQADAFAAGEETEGMAITIYCGLLTHRIYATTATPRPVKGSNGLSEIRGSKDDVTDQVLNAVALHMGACANGSCPCKALPLRAPR